MTSPEYPMVPRPCAAADAALVSALRDGRPGAADTAWKRFRPMVEGILRRVLGASADLPDFTQDVFLRFFGKVQGLQNPEALRSFLQAIAIRRALEELKRRKVRTGPAGAQRSAPEPAVTAVDPAVRQVIGRLGAAIERLRAVDRTFFLLRHVEGRGQQEIAAALGISVSTARRRLARANKRVVALLKADPVLAEHLSAATGMAVGWSHPPDQVLSEILRHLARG